jgi:hypothetical protein
MVISKRMQEKTCNMQKFSTFKNVNDQKCKNKFAMMLTNVLFLVVVQFSATLCHSQQR